MKIFREVLGVTGELLITLGVLLLLFLSWQLWWTDVEANADQKNIVANLENTWSKGGSNVTNPDDVPTGEAFALIRVPRLGQDWVKPIVKGTQLDTLNHGIGEYPNSAGPGKIGNFAIAGHRISWGRPFYDIDTIREGDYVIVETKSTRYVYEWKRHRIVSPSQTEILAPVPDKPGVKPTEPWMTITACHPKFSAEQRYIGYAKLVETLPREKGIPTKYLEVK